jgi:hypothetical protein
MTPETAPAPTEAPMDRLTTPGPRDSISLDEFLGRTPASPAPAQPAPGAPAAPPPVQAAPEAVPAFNPPKRVQPAPRMGSLGKSARTPDPFQQQAWATALRDRNRSFR